MRVKSFALLALALGCGLVASIGISQVMSNRGVEPVMSSGEVTVFVALEDIPLGDILEPQLLRLEPWPQDMVPAGALTKIEDAEGRRTKTKLYAGEPILENKLYPKGVNNQGASPRIPKGYRPIPVRVDSVSGTAGLILPGDRVDVMLYVTGQKCFGVVESGIYTILQDIKVFACNDVVEPDSSEEGAKSIKAQTISLLVTPEQAKKLMLATELGKVRLAMRSPEDDEITPDSIVTVRDMLGGSEKGSRVEESPEDRPGADKGPANSFLAFLEKMRAGPAADQPLPPASQAEPSVRTETWSVRLVSGSEVQDVTLEAEGEVSGSGERHWRVAQIDAASGLVGQDVISGMTSSTTAEEGQTPATDGQEEPEGEDAEADAREEST